MTGADLKFRAHVEVVPWHPKYPDLIDSLSEQQARDTVLAWYNKLPPEGPQRSALRSLIEHEGSRILIVDGPSVNMHLPGALRLGDTPLGKETDLLNLLTTQGIQQGNVVYVARNGINPANIAAHEALHAAAHRTYGDASLTKGMLKTRRALFFDAIRQDLKGIEGTETLGVSRNGTRMHTLMSDLGITHYKNKDMSAELVAIWHEHPGSHKKYPALNRYFQEIVYPDLAAGNFLPDVDAEAFRASISGVALAPRDTSLPIAATSTANPIEHVATDVSGATTAVKEGTIAGEAIGKGAIGTIEHVATDASGATAVKEGTIAGEALEKVAIGTIEHVATDASGATAVKEGTIAGEALEKGVIGFVERISKMHLGTKTAIGVGAAAVVAGAGYWASKIKSEKNDTPQPKGVIR